MGGLKFHLKLLLLVVLHEVVGQNLIKAPTVHHDVSVKHGVAISTSSHEVIRG